MIMNIKYFNICSFCKKNFESECLEFVCSQCLRKMYLSGNINTTTTNIQTQMMYEIASEDILDLFTEFGFITETPFDEKELKQRIVETIQKNVEGKDA